MKAALLLLCVLLPVSALADGFAISPGVTVGNVYDDDLAPAGSGPGSALFAEVSPTTALGYSSQRLTLLGHAALDVEALDEAPFRNTPWLRFASDATMTALLTERLTFTASGTFWDTNTPRDLNVLTGFDPGQLQANSESAETGLAYNFTALVKGSLDASFVSTAEAGLIIDEETARASLLRMFSERNGARFDLLYRRIDFLGNSGLNVEAPMLGWTHKFSSALGFELLAGPRFDNKSIEGLEGAASLTWTSEKLQLAANLASTQTTIAGFVGTVDTESASTMLMLRPSEHLFLSATPGFYVSSGAPLTTQVFELQLAAERTLGDNVALLASYRLTVQNSKYAEADVSSGGSVHNQIVLGVSFHAAGSPAAPFAWPMAGAWAGRAGSPPAPIAQPASGPESTMGIPSTIGVPLPVTPPQTPGMPLPQTPGSDIPSSDLPGSTTPGSDVPPPDLPNAR